MEGINQLQATGITVNHVHHRFALAWFSADLVARAGMLKLQGVRVLTSVESLYFNSSQQLVCERLTDVPMSTSLRVVVYTS